MMRKKQITLSFLPLLVATQLTDSVPLVEGGKIGKCLKVFGTQTAGVQGIIYRRVV